METTDRNTQVDSIAIAALLHDIGKLLQRGATREESVELENYHQEFCPVKGNSWSHLHASFTAVCIEKYLGWLIPEGGGDDNILSWSARHHKPTNLNDVIVSEADALSAGMDRTEHEPYKNWEATLSKRLVSVLSWAGRNRGYWKSETESAPWVPLGPLTVSKDNLFCRNSAPPTGREAFLEYQSLSKEFISNLKAIPPIGHGAVINSLMAILEKFTTSVPSATTDKECDISLFDHLRTTAALAACLRAGLEDLAPKSPEAWIRNRLDRRYLLIVGDINGIQKYLHALTSKKAAKTMRGRSFAVQLLTDAISRAVTRKLGIPACNILFLGGGTFWILAPTSRMQNLTKWAEETDLWLSRRSAGSLGFCIGQYTFSGTQLRFDKSDDESPDDDKLGLARVIDCAYKNLSKARHHRFREIAQSSYNQVFDVSHVDGAASPCEACGMDIRNPREGKCRYCEEAENLGRVLPRARFIIRAEGTDDDEIARKYANRNGIACFGGHIQTCYSLNDEIPHGLSASASLVSLGYSLPRHNSCSIGMWPVTHNCPSDGDGEPLTYDTMAALSSGAPRLGVLRADVDNLGLLFQQGLKGYETFSRVATLSRSLNVFFSAYLEHITEEQPFDGCVQVVYSGGDDLLVVGAWDRLPGLAHRISSDLSAYSDDNPNIAISAGIACGHPTEPLIALARDAAEDELEAKAFIRGNQRRKNAVHILGRTLEWPELKVAATLARDLASLVAGKGMESIHDGFYGISTDEPAREGSLPRSLLTKLLSIAEVEHDARRRRNQSKKIDDIREAAKKERWAWLSVYDIGRLEGREEEVSTILENIRNSLPTSVYRSSRGVRHIIEFLEVPVTWAAMCTRSGDSATSSRRSE